VNIEPIKIHSKENLVLYSVLSGTTVDLNGLPYINDVFLDGLPLVVDEIR
jgi:hypothetical protein